MFELLFSDFSSLSELKGLSYFNSRHSWDIISSLFSLSCEVSFFVIFILLLKLFIITFCILSLIFISLFSILFKFSFFFFLFPNLLNISKFFEIFVFSVSVVSDDILELFIFWFTFAFSNNPPLLDSKEKSRTKLWPLPCFNNSCNVFGLENGKFNFPFSFSFSIY